LRLVGILVIPFSTQARVSKNPGSDIAGVPASEIKAMVSPPFKNQVLYCFMLIMHMMTVHVRPNLVLQVYR
jgi:hypothetical protein